MRGTARPSLAVLAALPLALAACGGGSGEPSIDAAAQHDAPPTPPDGPPAPDAGPPPDAPPGAFTCVDTPLPGTAVDPLTIAGGVETVGLNGSSPVEGAEVVAFDASDAQLATDTSDATGAYSLTAASGGTPIDGYVRGTGPDQPDPTDDYKVTYVYPPYPLAESQANVPVLLITNGTFELLELASGETQSDTSGWIGVVVTDCMGNEVPGATVTTNPASGAIVYAGANQLPDTQLTATSSAGLAYIFNVPPGEVTIDATAGGHDLLDNAIDVRAGVITTTVIAPGPVTP